MKSLIPKHLLKLFTKEKEEDESREYSTNSEFNLTVQRLAKHKGRSEQEVLTELAQAAQEQLRNDKQMAQHWMALTLREQEVVALVCLGLRNDQIAEMMFIGPGTVKSHLQNIFEKFGLRDRKTIRLALKDWDFETWWQNHHGWPVSIPVPTTSE